MTSNLDESQPPFSENRIAELEAENRRLRERIAALDGRAGADVASLFSDGPVVYARWAEHPPFPWLAVSDSIRQFGYCPDDFLSGRLSFLDIVHPDDRNRLRETILEQHRADPLVRTAHHVYRIVCGDGRVRWVYDRTVRHFDAHDRLIDATGYLLDITELRETERTLRESEARYRLLAENALDLVVQCAPDGRIDYVSPSCETILGYSSEDMLGRHLREYLVSDDGFRLHRELAQLRRQNGGILTAEVRTKVGTRIWAESAVRFRRENARIVEIHIAGRDITERKLVQDQLARQAEILAAVRDAVIVTDLAGAVWYWNEGATRLLGWTASEAIGQPAAVFYPPAMEEDIRHKLLDRSGREEIRGEWLATRKNGEPVWIDAHIRIFTDARWTPIGTIVLAYDVSKRKQTEQALKASERNLRRITDHLPTAIAKLDTNLRYLFANPAYLRLVGTSFSYVVGRLKQDVVGEPAFSRMKGRIDQVLQGRGVTFEEELEYRSGKRWVSAQYLPELDERGQVCAFYAFITDITERKHLEEQFRQSQKMEAVGKLAGGIAHDFNNLLTIINGYSQMLMRTMAKDSTAHARMEQIRLAGERGAALTRQLLAFSRKQVLVPRSVNLNAIVTDLDHMVRRLIGEDIVFSLKLEPELWLVKADPGQLEQVIVNLIVNARDAMPTGGRLEVETGNVAVDEDFVSRRRYFKCGEYARLTIRDTGTGMDEGTKLRIFEPFFTTKEAGKGTGLGLATVYGIVKQSGGYIEVASAVNEGTTFELYFPRLGTVVVEETEEIPKLPALHGTERVLVVEDEGPLRELLRHALEDHGYIVEEAGDGDEALERLAELTEPIDLLLTDVVMPGISGRELAERVTEKIPTVKVLFMSGYTRDAFTDRGIDEADLALIHKPFTFDDLLLNIRMLFDQSR